jgi:hypothetical protein
MCLDPEECSELQLKDVLIRGAVRLSSREMLISTREFVQESVGYFTSNAHHHGLYIGRLVSWFDCMHARR